MKYRTLGKTNFKVSEISLGTWQVGGTWGSGFDDNLADRLLDEAIGWPAMVKIILNVAWL